MSDFHIAVSRAVGLVGGQAKLAQKVGCAQSEIWRLMNSAKSISPNTAIRIVKATKGAVTMRDLIPDVVKAVAAELAREDAR